MRSDNGGNVADGFVLDVGSMFGVGVGIGVGSGVGVGKAVGVGVGIGVALVPVVGAALGVTVDCGFAEVDVLGVTLELTVDWSVVGESCSSGTVVCPACAEVCCADVGAALGKSVFSCPGTIRVHPASAMLVKELIFRTFMSFLGSSIAKGMANVKVCGILIHI